MATYIDVNGDEYAVSFDVEVIRRVRKQTDFAFGTCLQNEMQPINELMDDYERLPEVLFSVVDPDGIDKRDFLNNCKGDALSSAQQSIWEAFAFFCPPDQRQMMLSIQEATKKLTTEQLKQAQQMVSTIIETHSQSDLPSDSNRVRTLTAS